MAKNEILIRVRTEGGKTILEAVNNTRKLKEATDGLSSSQRKGVSAAHAHHDAMNKGVIGTARNARDFSKLSQTIGSGNNGLVGAYATLAANTFAVVAAFSALQRATNAGKIMAGLEAQGARLGQTLSITSENIRELTGNAIAMADAMRSTAQLTAGGFDSTQIEELTKVARDASGALGRDLNDSMDRLARGVTKLEPELLDELGIMTKLDEASNLYAVSLNKTAESLTAAEKRQAFMNAVLAEGERKFGGIGEQVAEYDAYTRLAAAATDLFNESMGAVAGVLAPVAEFFAANKGLILGALVLYAATIRKDLIPALAEAAQRQKELVDQKGQGLASQAKAFAERAGAMEDAIKNQSVTTGRFLPRAGAKELGALAEAAEKGTVTLGDFRKAHVALSAQIENADDILKRAAEHTEDYQIALANKDVLQDAQKEVRGLTSAFYEQQAAQRGLNAMTIAQNAQFGNYITSIRGIGSELRGQFRDLQSSSAPLQEGGTRLERFSQAASAAGTTVGNMGRVAATGVRAFGSVALNALPVIGQVILAITLLQAAYQFLTDVLTTDEQKNLNKTQEEYNTILGESNSKQAAYNRLMDVSNSSMKAQTDALKITGNAVTELITKYNELLEARKAAEASSLLNKFGFTTSQENKNSTDEAATRFRLDRATTSGQTAQNRYVESLEALAAIRGVVNAEEKRAIDLQVEQIEKMRDSGAQLKATSALLENLGERYKGLTLAVENVQETFKNLEDQTTAFIQAANISTPVDKLAETLNKAATAAAELNIELMKNSASIVEVGRALAGSLGAQSRNLLGADISIVTDLENAQSEIKLLKDSYDELDAQGRAKLSQLAAREQQLAARMVTTVNERLQSTKELVRQSQIDYRTAKDRAALEEVRFNRVKDLLEVGAAGYLAREEHEEKVRATQVNQLDIQQSILEVMQTQAQATLENLRVKRADLQVELDRLDTLKEATELEKIGYRLRTGIATRSDIITDKSLQEKQAERLQLRIAQLDQSIIAASDGLSELGDSITSLDTQKAALLAKNLSAAEKAARAMGAEFEVSKKFLEQVDRYADTLFKLNRSIRDFNVIVTGSQNDTQAQLLEIVETYRSTRRSLIQQLATKASELQINEAILTSVRDSNSLTNLQADAAEKSLSVAEATYNNEYRTTELLIRQADVTMQLQALNLAVYDVRTDGVQWQERGIELLQKEVDLTQSIQDARNQITASQRRVNRANIGLSETVQSRANEEVRVSTEALRAAKAAAGIRMSAIDAEYALLNAQKIALEQELNSRIAILRAMGASEQYLGPIQNAVRILQQINVNELAELARKGVRMEIAVKEQDLIEAVSGAAHNISFNNSYLERVISDRVDRAERDRVSSAAQSALATQVAEGVGLVFSNSNNTGIAELTHAQEQALDPIVSIAEDVSAIRQAITGQGSSGIVAAGHALQGQGLRVSENASFGGVSAGAHRGRGHGEGRAIDVNFGEGNVEADIPDMKARFDALAKEYQSKGYVVLWNGVRYAPFQGTTTTAGHRDHMHIEMPGVRVDPTVSATAAQAEASATVGAPITQAQISANAGRLAEALPDASGTLASAAGDMEGITTAIGALHEEILVSGPRAAATFDENMVGIADTLAQFKTDFELSVEPLLNLAQQLGPDGEIITAVATGCFGVIDSVSQAFQVFGWEQAKFSDKLQASLAVASQVVSSIAAITSAASDARIRGIDQEIAAEQKRDGQSAASLAKLAELEKRKDSMAKKQFNTNKKLMMAQAVIATATGVTQALASAPFPFNIVLAGIIGAMGAAQLAIIAGTNYQGGASSANAGKISVPKLTIGRVGNSVNLDRSNTEAGGEIGYLRGSPGFGTNASNYSTIGSAYGGPTNRGYGHRSFLVGEKGPEFIETNEAMNISPTPKTAMKEGDTYHIHATDADSFTKLLENNPEAIARGLRRVANSSGERFMENVDLNSFKANKR